MLLSSLTVDSVASGKPSGNFVVEVVVPSTMAIAAANNEARCRALAHRVTVPGGQLTYERIYYIIKSTVDALSPHSDGNIVYVSEGANTINISRSSFPFEVPRQTLDAGTHATMGVGMGYAIAV